MGRPELGTKRTDPENGRKFYDLGKDPAVSPYTGTAYPLSFFDPPATQSRYGTATRYVKRDEKPEDEVVVEPQDEDEDDAETVSLADVEDDAQSSVADVDGVGDDEDVNDDDDDADDDRVLALDDDDEDDNLDEIIPTRDDDE
ncbi:TIGR02300 family protein [Mangrovicella endophytica]|uniref:TIGR02300 family protein n=1 Tax=Mangrovicella endophytica TaxID=2066697 RepID=UPI000C9E1BF6|nr:TIGR02300 family protein [Mangrovicella endophytica]